MATKIRPEVSGKNPYFVERHRYYELKHFCLQYPNWIKNIRAYDLRRSPSYLKAHKGLGYFSDPTAEEAERHGYYLALTGMVEKAARDTDPALSKYILIAVTKGLSYDSMLANHNIPCGKEYYYKRYRKFFWLLDKLRA